MKSARLVFRAGRDLFVSPRTMRNGPLEEGPVTEIVRESCFEQIQVRKLNPLFLQSRFICNKAGSVVERATSFRL